MHAKNHGAEVAMNAAPNRTQSGLSLRAGRTRSNCVSPETLSFPLSEFLLYEFFMDSLNNPYAPLDRMSRQELIQKGESQMGILLIISAISAGSIAFLIYFGFALWRDARQSQGRRLLVLKLRETIARKRYPPRVLYMDKLETIRHHQGERTRKL
jgi:hypothetical protein